MSGATPATSGWQGRVESGAGELNLGSLARSFRSLEVGLYPVLRLWGAMRAYLVLAPETTHIENITTLQYSFT